MLTVLVTYLPCSLSQVRRVSGADKYPDLTSLFAIATAPSDGGMVRYPCVLTQAISRYYAELRLLPGPDSSQNDGKQMAVARRVVEWMGQDGFTPELMQLMLPFGVALPLQRCLALCKVSPPSHWDARLLHLVGRADVLSMRRKPNQQVANQ